MRPPALRPGDTIAFVSPSTRANHIFPARIARAKSYFESLGYVVKQIYTALPPRKSESHLELVKARCRELESAFADPQVKCIICTIGGNTANELLEHLNYDLLAANPKIFMGYSDITILHHALYIRTSGKISGFYGPAVLPCWGEFPDPLDFTASHFWAMVNGEHGDMPRSGLYSDEFLDWGNVTTDTTPRTLKPAPAWKWLKTGPAVTGRLFGGCLPSLVQLLGTPYCPHGFYRDRILFLETPEGHGPADPFPLPHARAALFDLRNAGVLGMVKGIVVGRPFLYNDNMRAEFERSILDAMDGLDVPVLVNVDVGHTHPMLTLPMDVLCEMDSEADAFKLLESATRID